MTKINYTEPYFLAEDHYEEWLLAKGVLINFLKEINPGESREYYDHNSSAILARLAHADMLCVRLYPAPKTK